MIQDILKENLLGNSVMDYLMALGYFVAAIIAILIVRKIVLARLKVMAKKTATPLDDFLVHTIERFVVPLFYVGAFYLSTQTLTLHPTAARVITIIAISLSTILGIRFVSVILEYVIRQYWLKQDAGEARERSIKALIPAIKVVVWGIGVVFLLDNLGFEISAVVAGLGIGGIAVALAAQSVLGDLFSYLAIVLDRPFEVGDFIIVGDQLGTVERIGIKTTRLRSLSGEQLIFSNTDLTNSRVRNFKRMEQRRVLFKVGVTYDTPHKHVEEIPKIIKSIIENTERTRFDRAHFASYGDFSLMFEVVYFVLSSDYNTYMDIQQDINLRIMEEFGKRDIEFAFPTQTLHVHKVEANGSAVVRN